MILIMERLMLMELILTLIQLILNDQSIQSQKMNKNKKINITILLGFNELLTGAPSAAEIFSRY